MGEAGVAASVDDRGGLLVVTMGHPVHGQVQLTAAPDLRAGARYDQSAVRRFRRRLSAHAAPSFGIRSRRGVGSARSRFPAWLWHDALPLTSLGQAARATPDVVTLVPHRDDVEGATTLVQVRMSPSTPAHGSRWGGRFRLVRAPYPQLTEGGPLRPLRTQAALERWPEGLALSDGELGAAVAIGGDVIARADASPSLRRGWLEVDMPLASTWEMVGIGIGNDPQEARGALESVLARGPRRLLADIDRRWSARWARWSSANGRSWLARRGLAYAIGCCAVPMGQGTCLVTDHRLLPLAWTRDGYYIARALLDWGQASGDGEPVDIVRRHLDWLFRVADRPAGWWARSHLVGGQRKDEAFQADQQLYPLMELTDYTQDTGDRGPITSYANQVPTVLAALDARSDPDSGLFATDETPADDPAPDRYLISTQILAWRVFRQLSALGIGGSVLEARGEHVRAAVNRRFLSSLGGRRVFAYSIDREGDPSHDHDANDLPLAMAAEWGFCRATDPVWTATMEHALDGPHAGSFPGATGGLGSIHTPGPWPLGQLQATIAGSTSQTASQALLAEAQWDGLLPEASDARTGRPISRPWFAWPGAVVASRYLADGLSAGREAR